MTLSQILGFAGTALVIAGYIPQIVRLIKERCTAGINIPAFSLVRSVITLADSCGDD